MRTVAELVRAMRSACAVACAVLGCVTPGCTWGGCYDAPYTYAVSDAQVTRLMEGTASPTMNGCNAVCLELRNNAWNTVPVDYVDADWGVRDGGHLDAGVGARGFVDAASVGNLWPPPESCSLSGHQLTCVWHQCAL